jgi:hypothetical protein
MTGYRKFRTWKITLFDLCGKDSISPDFSLNPTAKSNIMALPRNYAAGKWQRLTETLKAHILALDNEMTYQFFSTVAK